MAVPSIFKLIKCCFNHWSIDAVHSEGDAVRNEGDTALDVSDAVLDENDAAVRVARYVKKGRV